MPKLPVDVSGQQLCRALQRVGFLLVRQSGSHMVLRRDTPKTRVVVPNHKAIRPGTLNQILKAAGVSVEELVSLL